MGAGSGHLFGYASGSTEVPRTTSVLRRIFNSDSHALVGRMQAHIRAFRQSGKLPPCAAQQQNHRWINRPKV
jgi:hypothetical protein